MIRWSVIGVKSRWSRTLWLGTCGSACGSRILKVVLRAYIFLVARREPGVQKLTTDN